MLYHLRKERIIMNVVQSVAAFCLFVELGGDMAIGQQSDNRDGNDGGQDEQQEYAPGEFAVEETVIDLEHLPAPPQ